MNISKVCKMILIIIVIVIAMPSCARSEFDKSVLEFEKIYFGVAGEIDIKDTKGSIERLESTVNKENINEMKLIIDKVSFNIPNNRVGKFKDIVTQYEGLVFLQEVHSKWNELFLHEQSRINTEIWWAYKLSRDNKN